MIGRMTNAQQFVAARPDFHGNWRRFVRDVAENTRPAAQATSQLLEISPPQELRKTLDSLELSEEAWRAQLDTTNIADRLVDIRGVTLNGRCGHRKLELRGGGVWVGGRLVFDADVRIDSCVVGPYGTCWYGYARCRGTTVPFSTTHNPNSYAFWNWLHTHLSLHMGDTVIMHRVPELRDLYTIRPIRVIPAAIPGWYPDRLVTRDYTLDIHLRLTTEGHGNWDIPGKLPIPEPPQAQHLQELRQYSPEIPLFWQTLAGVMHNLCFKPAKIVLVGNSSTPFFQDLLAGIGCRDKPCDTNWPCGCRRAVVDHLPPGIYLSPESPHNCCDWLVLPSPASGYRDGLIQAAGPVMASILHFVRRPWNGFPGPGHTTWSQCLQWISDWCAEQGVPPPVVEEQSWQTQQH
jgi:hypothetical protein